eukprot:3440734-Lingulodinium_polyedra.AAC.2
MIHYGHDQCTWDVALQNPANRAALEDLGDLTRCGCYPMRSSAFYLACSEGKVVMYEEAGRSSARSNIHWHCPACFDRYEQKNMNQCRPYSEQPKCDMSGCVVCCHLLQVILA